MLQIELNTSDFGISAEKFQLNPRELLTTALQPLWAENQTLELARIAFEVSKVCWPACIMAVCLCSQMQMLCVKTWGMLISAATTSRSQLPNDNVV